MHASGAKQPCVDTMHAGLTRLMEREETKVCLALTAHWCKSGVLLLRVAASVWSQSTGNFSSTKEMPFKLFLPWIRKCLLMAREQREETEALRFYVWA